MNFLEFNLDSRLMAGITRAGYTMPTPIQIAAIPAALAGNDLIGTAQTGTGKTAAFVLPILHKLLNGPRNQARALIVTPTRELAEQIHDNVRLLGAGTGLRSATIYGGVGAAPQIKALRDGVEILVACPGRLLDLIDQGYARLDNVEVLVLDEADRMFDMGFLPSVKRILKHVPAQTADHALLGDLPEGDRGAGPADADPAEAHRDGAEPPGAHRDACALPGAAAPESRTAAGAAQADRHRIRC